MQYYEFKAVNSFNITRLSGGGSYPSYEEAMKAAYQWWARISDKKDMHLEVVPR